MIGYYFHTVKIWVKFPYSLGYGVGAESLTVRLVGQDVALSRQRHGFKSHTVHRGRQLGANSIHASIVQVRFLTYPVRYLNRQSLPLITGSI